MTKKIICIVACAALTAVTMGCSTGPFRNFCRGAWCNSCQPPVGQPAGCGTNVATGCSSGTCGTGGSSPYSSSDLNGPYISTSGYSPQQNNSYFPDSGFVQPGDSAPSYTPNNVVPTTELDPFSVIPESSNVYGADIGAPYVSPSQGSGSR